MTAKGKCGYTEFTVIVDGALDEELMLEWADEDYDVKQSSLLDGCEQSVRAGDCTEVDVFIIEHAHEMSDEECACVQYLTDHAPTFRFISGQL